MYSEPDDQKLPLSSYRHQATQQNSSRPNTSIIDVPVLTKSTHRLFRGQGGMIADNIVHRNADREGHSSINGLSVDFLCIQLGSLCFHDGVTELAKIQDLSAGDALGDKTF